MSPAALADIILVTHIIFVAVVVLGVPLIGMGGAMRWEWVRPPVFRLTHLAMIAFVAFESLTGITCPLTTLETRLRRNAAQQGYNSDGFIATWFDKLLFHPLPHEAYIAIYVGFALLVASLFYFVPVRWIQK